jgi:uncharacterized Fe-S center protein
MSKVYFIRDHLLRKFREVIQEQVKGFSEGDKVAVKMHMGEYGNLNYVRPPIAELVVDELKRRGAKPFIIDSPTAYHGKRHNSEEYLETARKNGFSEETMGCPIIISDEGIDLESRYLNKMEVLKEIKESDGIVVLSHFKGHSCSGFGGCIKNLGMGGFTKETKGMIHSCSQSIMVGECSGCGSCVNVCPFDAISMKEGKAVIDPDNCFGCSACINICPSKALKAKKERFGKILTEAAHLLLKGFEKEKQLFINVLLDISKSCDCHPIGDDDVGPIVSPNIGIMVSKDIVSIEKASLDIADRHTDGKFSKIYHANPMEQIEAGVEFGMGSSSYEIEEV